ncbi:MAG: tRNA adenosine(34) deaminase TadA [Pantoea sp. Brub]|nr:tRNA adenosine(34) deaminase TadA [Pantoea sp. Brub]
MILHKIQDEYWMQYALKMAYIAFHKNEVPVGAVLIKKNQLISEGYNTPISYNDPTAHAEVMAIRQGSIKINNYRLLDTTLYVTLEPCIMCIGAIIHSRIKRLVYGAHNTKTGTLHSPINAINDFDINHKIKISSGILLKECANVLNIFFYNKRRK